MKAQTRPIGIAGGRAAGVTFGPNVNVTYATYKDAFAKAITGKTAFGPRRRPDAGPPSTT